ncbi:glycosyltransferase family 39 protein [Candidatus Uabimicrobium sp. HlEnr_7]|uniref:glycosyltransferase family 39 protein n=1 Tax=Candidatus Uabimicrobium helgolandensis TaxID=3095367 RepID=UPI00355713E1
MSRIHKILFSIILLGFVLRIIVVFYSPDHFVFSDSVSYNQIAHNILSGTGFHQTQTLQAVRPPLYSSFLALIYLLNTNILTIKILQTVIGCFSIFLVFILAKKLLRNSNAALIAAFLFAVDPLQIAFCSLVLTETWFCFLFLCSLLLLFETRESSNSKNAVLLGCLCGIGSLFRTVLLPFVAFVGIFWMCSKRSQWRLVIVFWISTFIIMTPWIIRNAVVFGDFVPTTTKTGVNLYEALGPNATGGPRMLIMKLPSGYSSLNEIQRDKFLRKKTWEFLKENPFSPLYLAIVKFFRLWNIGFNDLKLRNLRYVNYAIMLFSCGLYICFFYGLLFLQKKNRFYLLLPILYVSLIHMIFLGSIRYRVPVLACLDIIAAIAIHRIFLQFTKIQNYIGE